MINTLPNSWSVITWFRHLGLLSVVTRCAHLSPPEVRQGAHASQPCPRVDSLWVKSLVLHLREPGVKIKCAHRSETRWSYNASPSLTPGPSLALAPTLTSVIPLRTRWGVVLRGALVKVGVAWAPCFSSCAQRCAHLDTTRSRPRCLNRVWSRIRIGTGSCFAYVSCYHSFWV